MRCLLMISVALFGASLSDLSVACERPDKVDVPNGSFASKSEMIEVQDKIRNYVDEMGVYLECILSEEKRSQRTVANLSPQEEQSRQNLISKKYNAAIDEMEEVVLQHNREAKKFRDKDKT